MVYANKKIKNMQGQTLVALLFFVLIGLIVTIASAIILSTNSLAASKLTQAEITRELAETGIENALLKLLRNKNYTGETLIVDDATILITVTGTATKTISATATLGSFIRTMEVVAPYDGVLEPGIWREIF